ncbi:MAG: hypothetical protein ACTHJS_08675 [Xanthobacteraceae bacterium]
MSARSVGRLKTVTGLVAITRDDTVLTQPVAGDAVFQGDVIETGIDGSVTIAFRDGTWLRLYADTRMELDELPCGGERLPASALVRIVRGRFDILDGDAANERITIDTPLGQLRKRTPGFGAGTVAIGIFSFAFLPEVKADSADIALLDNGAINYDDLKHGVYEIITKGDHPERLLVDSTTHTFVLRFRGSSVSVSEVANTPLQMAQLQNAYSDAYAHYTQGLNDPFFQQWQHAFAQPQSGSNGSGDPASILSFHGGGGNPLLNGGGGIFVQPVILDNTGAGSGKGIEIIIPPPQPPPVVLTTPPTLSLSENVSDESASNPIKGVIIGPTSSPVVVSLTVLNGSLHVDDSSLPAGVTSITGDGSNHLVVSGDAAAVNNLLNGLTYALNVALVGADEGTDILTVSVTSGGSTTTASSNIIVNPVAVPPEVTASAVAIDEGHSSTLTLGLANASTLFEDPDDSVVITVTLSNGATLTQTGGGAAVIDNPDGTFTVTATKLADLAGLTITPTSEFEGTVTVGVSAVAHDGSSTATGTTSTTLIVNPVAEQPVVTASAVAIDEGHSSTLTLGLTNAATVFEDGDDSVVVTVTLSNGATLTQTGGGAAVIDNPDGTFTVTATKLADLAGLTIDRKSVV